MREETFSALRRGGARLNGSLLGVSDTRAFGRALLGTGFPYDRRQHTDFYLAYLAEAMRRTQGVRRGGAAAPHLCYLARRRLGALLEGELHPPGTGAGRRLVEGGGGRAARLPRPAHRLPP